MSFSPISTEEAGVTLFSLSARRVNFSTCCVEICIILSRDTLNSKTIMSIGRMHKWWSTYN